MAISAVGAFTANASGQKTIAVSPAAAGNLICLVSQTVSSALGTTAVAGGGVPTWARMVGPYTDPAASLSTFDIWFGAVATPGAGTITVTNGASGSNTFLGFQEFTNGATNTTWAIDGAQTGTIASISAPTVIFPQLTPSRAGCLYFGYGNPFGIPTVGGVTAGYDARYDSTSGLFIVFNTNTPVSPQQPTCPQSVSGTTRAVGGVLTASVSPTGFAAFFM